MGVARSWDCAARTSRRIFAKKTRSMKTPKTFAMKRYLATLAFLLLFATASHAQTPAEDAIKNIIIAETEHFLNADFGAWSACFVQKPYLLWSVTDGGEVGDVITYRGWEDFQSAMKTSWFDAKPDAWAKEMRKAQVTRHNWIIQIRGKVAWASFTQRSETPQQMTETTETRVLEKQKGVWKMAQQTTLTDFKDAVPPLRSGY
jgi:hypothetical protein